MNIKEANKSINNKKERYNMNFKKFAKAYRHETFMAAAFNEIEDFDAFLDDPECGIGNPAFDEFSEEINEVLLPCFRKED